MTVITESKLKRSMTGNLAQLALRLNLTKEQEFHLERSDRPVSTALIRIIQARVLGFNNFHAHRLSASNWCADE
jgi:hypothetical protein